MKTQAQVSLHDLLNYYPISASELYRAARVHRTTWQRWLDKTSTPPAATLELLRLVATGEIPDPAFSDFVVRKGALYDASGNAYTPADLRELPLLKQQQARYFDLLQRISNEKKAAQGIAPNGPNLRLVR